MNKKILAGVILFSVLSVSIITWQVVKNRSEDSMINENGNTVDQTFLLEEYPKDLVPLHNASDISSSKFFVNDDPNNFSTFLDTEFMYFNVVYYTDDTPKDTISYYKSLMDSVTEEGDNMVEGTVGKYRVEASNYGYDMAYIQVHFPEDEFSKTNPYFDGFEIPVVEDSSWLERESSYGYLNQNGGEIEYTKYYTTNWDMKTLLSDYTEMYSDYDGFTSLDEETIKWLDGVYTITLSFSEDHGRVYLMIRKGM